MLPIFNVSKRTFQRRLKDQGCTFKELLDKTRKELAKTYVCNGEMKLDKISSQIGFTETSAFMRAFKRWYGCSPLRYRQECRLK